jgi:hypothetical protein
MAPRTGRPGGDEDKPVSRLGPEAKGEGQTQDSAGFARDLNDLAQRLKGCPGLEQAVPLIREALLESRARVGSQHQTTQAILMIYAEFLQAMGTSEEQIRSTLRELAPEAFLR